jgi:transposase
MSLQPQAEYCVPLETARVAKTVFPNGNIYLTLADSLGDFLADQDFAELFPEKGKPAESPFRLALASILQYIEGLTVSLAGMIPNAQLALLCHKNFESRRKFNDIG